MSQSAYLKGISMHLRTLIFLVLISGACSTSAVAGNFLHGWHPRRVCDCIGKWCCPDYCQKPAPCVCVPFKATCDDYCAKPAPCVRATINFCCDDYCPKCPPPVCGQPVWAWLKCGPASCRHKASTTEVTAPAETVKSATASAAKLPAVESAANFSAEKR